MDNEMEEEIMLRMMQRKRMLKRSSYEEGIMIMKKKMGRGD